MYTRQNHRQAIQDRKHREREHRRQTILAAAKRVFFSKGYAKATMDEIAMAAEISKPTIYQYFKTKDDLYFSLVLPVLDELDRQWAELEAGLEAGRYRSGARLVRDLFKAYYHCYETSPEGFMILELLQQTNQVRELGVRTRAALSERGRSSFARGRHVLELGIEQGLIRPVDVHQAADILWGLFVGVVQLEIIKSQQKRPGLKGDALDRLLKPTLKLAEALFTEALCVEGRV
ncbi:MAG: TetR/AcrR family transcriptional regulator [Proteobacteria bacterium]|nr:TetR/AcrR family transcriptional regulator [Pseudomonadota bacterium]